MTDPLFGPLCVTQGLPAPQREYRFTRRGAGGWITPGRRTGSPWRWRAACSPHASGTGAAGGAVT